MNRKCHFLKGNKTTETIHHAIWFDTETNQERIQGGGVKHILDFGFAAYSRRKSNGRWTKPEWFKFHEITEFWEFVDSHVKNKTKLYMFCHNTNFDLPVLDVFGELPKLGYELKFAVIEGPPTILKWQKPGGAITILDTLNWWRVPLKVLGVALNFPKLDMPDKDADICLWDTYCKKDTEIIIKAVQDWSDFILFNDYGGFAYTLAGQAYGLYRHRFMPHKIAIHDNEKACELEREAYKGGRNECFRTGLLPDKWTLYDINSMYPYVMSTRLFPTKLKYFSKRKNLDDLIILLQDYAVIARVKLNTLTPAYCIKQNDKLIFPVGEFTATLCTPELKYAIENNDIVSVEAVTVYEQAEIFKDYVDEVYKLKTKSKILGETLNAWKYKILLNSLYGKFGQKGLVFINQFHNIDIPSRAWLEFNVEEGTTERFRSLAGLVQKLDCQIESRDSFPGIAAHVTAEARMLLWSIINEVGPGNVAYCDTDAILISPEGKKRLKYPVHATDLGALSLDGEYDYVRIFACKDYEMGDKKRTKGVKKTAEWIGKNTIKQDKWSSLKGLLRLKALNAPTTVPLIKHLSRIYEKGLRGPCGSIFPFWF